MNAMLRMKKYGMIPELLGSSDARLRHVGVMGLHELFGTWRRSSDEQKNSITPAMLAQVEKIVRNREESDFVRRWAVGLLQHYELEKLRKFRELLVDLIENGPGQEAAIAASMALYTDPESYKIIFPPTLRAISAATNFPMAVSQCARISNALKQASPEIQAYGLAELKKVYQEQPSQLVSERGIYVIPNGAATKQKALGLALGFSEEGRHFVKLLPKETMKSIVTGKPEDMYRFTGKFTPNPKIAGKFTPNPKIAGTWTSCWFPRQELPAQSASLSEWVEWLEKKYAEKPDAFNSSKDTLVLSDDGNSVKSGVFFYQSFDFWADNMLVSNPRGDAMKITPHTTKSGTDFLLIERQDYEKEMERMKIDPEDIPKDFHPGYNIYIRVKSLRRPNEP
jgi:hypothetical protein